MEFFEDASKSPGVLKSIRLNSGEIQLAAIAVAD